MALSLGSSSSGIGSFSILIELIKVSAPPPRVSVYSEIGEVILTYPSPLRRLDDEFNEVVKCYKGKMEEVMEDAEELNKQMDALIGLRFRVDNPAMGSRTSDAMNLAANGKKPVRSHMDVIQEAEMSTKGNVDDEVRPDNEPKSSTNHSKAGVVGFRPPSLKVLNHVKINCNKYIGNRCFSLLNLLAFSKIMKKYDTITSRNTSKAYLEMIDKSYFLLHLMLPQVTRLIERVEATFIKHFSNGNRRKAINTLRQQAKSEKHRMTYFLEIYLWLGRGQYMENIFPLYSLFGFIDPHMIMFSGNNFCWHFRVNYAFIFGFKKGMELGYREVLLVSSAGASYNILCIQCLLPFKLLLPYPMCLSLSLCSFIQENPPRFLLCGSAY
ncbi:hypothetical protein LOK49_LG04G03852 [Camellia lanceoleosa]|uniref:Uncharacterized protein n=1 Tax=Camellia lanceoleosa TaxID=1840588 RepID=A0ACC0I661_9ERIC|nr:hypothetical protein LOK49_LG04G03852 [Camellia lanceoleosa]